MFVRSCIPQTRTRESGRESLSESNCQIWSTREGSSGRLNPRGTNEQQGHTVQGARLLNRREFNGLCAALSALGASSSASALDAPVRVTATSAAPTVKLRGGTVVPALGQGSWHLGQAVEEEKAVRTGLGARKGE